MAHKWSLMGQWNLSKGWQIDLWGGPFNHSHLPFSLFSNSSPFHILPFPPPHLTFTPPYPIHSLIFLSPYLTPHPSPSYLLHFPRLTSLPSHTLTFSPSHLISSLPYFLTFSPLHLHFLISNLFHVGLQSIPCFLPKPLPSSLVLLPSLRICLDRVGQLLLLCGWLQARGLTSESL